MKLGRDYTLRKTHINAVLVVNVLLVMINWQYTRDTH